MSTDFDAKKLDIASFAKQEAQLQGEQRGSAALQQFPRLADGVRAALAEDDANAHQWLDGLCIQWLANGALRTVTGARTQNLLELAVRAKVPQQCQLCLHPLMIALDFKRTFRFVADEATAEREDAEAEEDLLVLSRHFDLLALIEDELLMDLPVVPKHDHCPVNLPRSAVSADFEAAVGSAPGAEAKDNPFAALAKLKLPRS